jgi:toxin ParE1/3/4
MRVRFTLEALSHITGIHSYIEARSPQAASRVLDRIFAEVARLSEFPQLGRGGFVPGTYERTVPGLPYILVHEISYDNELVILAVFHGAQDRYGRK